MDRATSCGCFSVVYPGNASITTRVKIGDHDILPQDLGSTVKNECVCGITVSTGSCTPDEEDTSRFMQRSLLDSDDWSSQITDIVKASKQLHKTRTDTIKTTVHSVASGQLVVDCDYRVISVVQQNHIHILSTKCCKVVIPRCLYRMMVWVSDRQLMWLHYSGGCLPSWFKDFTTLAMGGVGISCISPYTSILSFCFTLILEISWAAAFICLC